MAGGKIVSYTDKILDDIHTLSQAADTLLTSIDTRLAQFGFDGSWQKVVEGPHEEIHEGGAYSIYLPDLTFAKNGEIGIIFTTANSTKQMHVTPLISVADKSTFDILQAPTLDVANYPAQFQTPINRNQNSSNTSLAWSVRAAPVQNQVGIILDGDTTPISADGTNLQSEVIGGAKNRISGGGIRDLSERVLKSNTTYYYRLVGDNTGTGGLGVTMALTWYEREATS